RQPLRRQRQRHFGWRRQQRRPLRRARRQRALGHGRQRSLPGPAGGGHRGFGGGRRSPDIHGQHQFLDRSRDLRGRRRIGVLALPNQEYESAQAQLGQRARRAYLPAHLQLGRYDPSGQQ